MSKGRHTILFIKIFLSLISFLLFGFIFFESGCVRNFRKPAPLSSKPEMFNRQHEFVDFFDDFNDPNLNHEKWKITRKGDFKISIIDIFDKGSESKRDYRLRLRADTVNTRDDTVKCHGVRCRYQIDLTIPKKISVDLDWNNQTNGCYLTAAIYICPTITTENPQDEENWLRFEYIGVPPGENARCAISTKINNSIRHLYTEGWPGNRRGRFISYQKIDFFLNDKGFEILENGKNLYGVKSQVLNFSSGYLYLQMTSHSNYPDRDIYFDNIIISRIPIK